MPGCSTSSITRSLPSPHQTMASAASGASTTAPPPAVTASTSAGFRTGPTQTAGAATGRHPSETRAEGAARAPVPEEATIGTPEHARARAAAVFNAAADRYDDAPNTFWARFGRETVERLELPAGARVLDVCCGSGASAIPAAEHVGPSGYVLAVDVADRLLDLAREKARAAGLDHVEFRVGDMLDTRLPNASFDAVVCVFGIFFVPDMSAAVRELWRLVRPGGALAVTTWGPHWMEPVNDVFWEAVREVRPDLHRGFQPWDRITEAEAVHDLLASGGADTARVVAVPGWHPIATPDDWWSVALGSGLRATLDALDDGDRERVRRATTAFVAEQGVADVEVNVIYATARKLHVAAD